MTATKPQAPQPLIPEAILTALRECLGPEAFTTSEFRDNFRIIVFPSGLYRCLECLKNKCGFDMLVDVTAVDYLHYPEAKDRFGVIYALLNTISSQRAYVKTFLNEPDLEIPSAFPLWKGADWMEREVYDMYGIGFRGHPDLRRILMPEEFTAYPLRKDYPLRGYGERHNFPAITRAES
jgi:NADH-quinone oxidoreductase subunit C